VVTSLSYEVRHGTSSGFIGIEVYQYAAYLTQVKEEYCGVVISLRNHHRLRGILNLNCTSK